jgi:hypothetical protein
MRATVFHDPFDVRIEQGEKPHCRSQRMPSFASPMLQFVGLIYGPPEGWNPFHQGGGWAMSGWEQAIMQPC